MSHEDSTHSNGGPDVLGEDDSLKLNNKEVDQVLDIFESTFQILTWDGVVLARAHLGGKTTVENEFTRQFRSSNDWYGLATDLVHSLRRHVPPRMM